MLNPTTETQQLQEFNSLQNAYEFGLLALVVWREARGEAQEAQIGVAYTILNRVDRPSWWGGTVADVICKKWQFSSMTDPRDKQLTTWPKAGDKSWDNCMRIVEGVLSGEISNPAPGADSYFDDSIPAPYWADQEKFVGKIGRIFFYNLDQDYELG